MSEPLVVSGLVVPPELVPIAASPRWTAYTEDPRLDPELVASVFGETPDASWSFYALDEIEGMTASWHAENDPDWFGQAPNDIEPLKSVLIGELGADRPFALDYRTTDPRVRLMTVDARWIVVADSVADLLRQLGIET